MKRWRAHPTFAARVEELPQESEQHYQRLAIARKRKRVELLQSVLDDLLRVKSERAALPVPKRIAGGKTGLVTRTDKIIGAGQNAKLVHEDALDEALLRNVRELLDDARKELGEGAGIEESVTFTRRYVGIDLSKV